MDAKEFVEQQTKTVEHNRSLGVSDSTPVAISFGAYRQLVELAGGTRIKEPIAK